MGVSRAFLILVLVIGMGCATKGDVNKMGDTLRGEMTIMAERLTQVQESLKGLSQSAKIVTATNQALVENLKAEEKLLKERLNTIQGLLKTLEEPTAPGR